MGGLLDHKMSSVAYNIKLISDVSVSFTYRAVHAVNLPELAQHSSKIFWSNVQHLADVNDKLHYLNSHLLQLFYKRAPNKTCWIKNSKPLWISTDVIRVFRDRHRAYKTVLC